MGTHSPFVDAGRRLLLSCGDLVLRTVAIRADRITIGRRPYNDITLDDLTVSGEHAVIERLGAAVRLRDLRSRNGTMVNGHLVSERILRDGDVVEIGVYRLTLCRSPHDAEDPDEFERTWCLQTEVRPTVDVAAAANPDDRLLEASTLDASDAASERPAIQGPPKPAPAVPPAPVPVIDILCGPQAGERIRLDRPITSLGMAGAQVAVVARRGDAYHLTHLEGPSFPLVNGESIGLNACALGHDDLIELGGTMLRYRVRG